MISTLLVVAALAVPGETPPSDPPGDRAGDPAYRVGNVTSRVAILPVRCERDLDPSLCRALGESMALEIARDPRMEPVNPHDLEVLVGAASLTELQSCANDDCFAALDFTRIDAAYMLALDVSRIGGEARLVLRMVDLKRGTVIDRADAKAPQKNEPAIEDAARELTMRVLLRRGLATPPPVVAEEEGGPAPVFWAGLGTFALGAVAAGGGGVLGVQGMLRASEIEDGASSMSRDQFNTQARDARTYAYGADLLFVAGGALAVAGGAMMLVGGL